MSKQLSFKEICSFPDLSLPKYSEYLGSDDSADYAASIFKWLEVEFLTQPNSTFTLRYVYDPATDNENSKLRIFLIFGDDGEGSFEKSLSMYAEGFEIRDANAEQLTPNPSELENVFFVSRKIDYFQYEGDHFVVPRPISGPAGFDAYELDRAFSAFKSRAILDVRYFNQESRPSLMALRALASRLNGLNQTESSGFLEDNLSNVESVIEEFDNRLGGEIEICSASSDFDTARTAAKVFSSMALGVGATSINHCAPGSDPYRSHVDGFINVDRPSDRTGEWYDTDLKSHLTGQARAVPAQRMREIEYLCRLKFMLGTESIRASLTLPVPQSGTLRTFPLETQITRDEQIVGPTSSTEHLFLGKNLDLDRSFSLPVSDLTKHAFIAGVTGSGKTVTMANILAQLACQNVPFLVLEPAKREYRSLIGLSELRDRLRVFTPGRDDVSPLRINPFELASSVSLAQHVSGLTAAFDAALDFGPVITSVVEAAIWKTYFKHGWLEDDVGEANNPLPSISELQTTLLEELEALGYDDETQSRFSGAIKNRFSRLLRGSIGRIFDCQSNVPSTADIFNSMSIIELAQLHPSEANLISLFFLSSLREYLESTVESRNSLKLVLIFEEAHNLIPSIDENVTGENSGGGRAEASRYISNMLAELRALGLGIIIVDQTPAAVANQVIRNTNLKIVHRTVAKSDRETLADATLMTAQQADLLGRLRPGQAYIYFDKLFRPELLKTPFKVEKTEKNDLEISSDGILSDADLLSELRSKEWYMSIISERGKNAVLGSDQLKEETKEFFDLIVVDEEEGTVELPDFAHYTAKDIQERIHSQLVELRALMKVAEELVDLPRCEYDLTNLAENLGVLVEGTSS